MAKLRNKTDQTLETRLGPRRYTTEPDGVLEISDEDYLKYAWPTTIWDDIEVPSGDDEKPQHRARKSTASKEND